MLLDIPTKPESLSKIRELIKNDRGINEIIDVINKDISLASTVIRAANTPIFSRGRRIDSISQAANVLGIKKLETIAMHAALKNYSYSATDRKALDVIWRHSELVAIACDIIAGHCYKQLRECAYIAGLFHDCGIPIFIRNFENYNYFICMAIRCPDINVAAEERKKYGVDHCSIGGLICEKWGLPEEVVIGVKYHHCKCDDVAIFDGVFKLEHFYMIAILLLADHFVQNIDTGITGSYLSLNEWISRHEKAIKLLGIDEYDIADLKDDFLEKAFTDQ